MKATVDRIENEIAVLLIRPDEKYDIAIPIKYFPDGSKEGDILNLNFEIDRKETEDAKKRVGNLIDKLKNKDN